MFPWYWYWAPQIHFPWSGSVAQQIAPETDWFFGGIAPTAGDGRIEQRAFSVATYGRQLGLITEVLLDLAQQVAPATPKGRESVTRLKTIRAEIEALKADEYERMAQALAEQLQTLQQRGGDRARAVEARLRPLLALVPPAD